VGSDSPMGGSATQYFIGQFDGQTFTNAFPEQSLWLDYGPDNYAGTTFNNAPDGQYLFMAWMSNWLYARETPTTPWRGAMTLPRSLFLKETPSGLRLAQAPIPELEKLRQPIGIWNDLALNGETQFPNLKGQCLEIIAQFELGSATSIGIQVLKQDQSRATLRYDVASQQLRLDRPSLPIENFTTSFSAPLVAQGGQIKLHIFVDRSSIEVFANDGEATLTAQVFGDPAGDDVAFFASGGTARLTHLEAYQLKSIWI
jgi:fructan beta-fructosidase